mgnify:CR=1 FL=1
MHLKAKKRIKKFLKDKQVRFKECKQVKVQTIYSLKWRRSEKTP